MPGLVLDNIRKSFGAGDVLRDVTLEVPDGALVTLLGPSDSGKTTLLRIAAGLERPDRGRVRMGERDVTATPAGDRDVGMVFQGFALFPHMTVAENVGFGLAARGTAGPEMRRRVEEAARVAGCDALLDRRPHELSGGERQRAALARAVAREPAVFLLDEPLSNLDAPLRAGMRAELKRLQRRVETSMVYVTHDQVEALTLGDLVAILDRGTVQQIGTPEEVFRRPANRVVASFLGTPGMNVIQATVANGKVRAGPFSIAAPKGVATDGPVELGIRPADVAVGRAGSKATVELVEVSGEQSFVHLLAHDVPLVAVTSTASRPAVGAEVRVRIDPAQVYLFDAETEVTLWHPD